MHISNIIIFLKNYKLYKCVYVYNLIFFEQYIGNLENLKNLMTYLNLMLNQQWPS